ncbi:VWA domain-containing protein [Bifidobacterium boum]|uniref:VWA domain-containing protein n=1 Tax=Bifidobacterium boum TaxID=78343 RepID=UPI00242E688E|nr:VWA domain-containing protein [Bifidobacterium boum]MCI5860948.1 VWA domain-containing protein [Bifidobacterium boum]
MRWQWPWAALIAIVAALAITATAAALTAWHERRTAKRTPDLKSYSLDDDLNTEYASELFHQWRLLSRIAASALAIALVLSVILIARPSHIDEGTERSASRDIVLCLDVSGSTLPYDRQIIDTYLKLASTFQGERIGMSIFNSTSRTVFPLTDDYTLVTSQLKSAASILKGVQTQDDIDKMSDHDYQNVSDWLDGTQNKTNATSLIGDGLVSCAAMLPGFAYGSTAAATSGDTAANKARRRSASIVLATDNVVSGKETYTLSQALDLTSQASISVDAIYAGAKESLSDQTTTAMKTAVESHGGTFMSQADGSSIESLVRQIEQRSAARNERDAQSAVDDDPGWWTLALAVCVLVWLVFAWRLRR